MKNANYPEKETVETRTQRTKGELRDLGKKYLYSKWFGDEIFCCRLSCRWNICVRRACGWYLCLQSDYLTKYFPAKRVGDDKLKQTGQRNKQKRETNKKGRRTRKGKQMSNENKRQIRNIQESKTNAKRNHPSRATSAKSNRRSIIWESSTSDKWK